VPFAAVPALKRDGEGVSHLKRRYRLWLSRPVEGTIEGGSISQDARGRWYFTLRVEPADTADVGSAEVALDVIGRPWLRSRMGPRYHILGFKHRLSSAFAGKH